MFQKSAPETLAAQPPVRPADASAAQPQARASAVASTAPARASQSSAPASVFGANLDIRGDIEGRGEIHLQGRAWGDVRVERLVIGEAAELEGCVVATTVDVSGRVAGSITATSVRLFPSARVTGDITYERLQIEPGALFDGRCIVAKAQSQPQGDDALSDDDRSPGSSPPEPSAVLAEAAA